MIPSHREGLEQIGGRVRSKPGASLKHVHCLFPEARTVCTDHVLDQQDKRLSSPPHTIVIGYFIHTQAKFSPAEIELISGAWDMVSIILDFL